MPAYQVTHHEQNIYQSNASNGEKEFDPPTKDFVEGKDVFILTIFDAIKRSVCNRAFFFYGKLVSITGGFLLFLTKAFIRYLFYFVGFFDITRH